MTPLCNKMVPAWVLLLVAYQAVFAAPDSQQLTHRLRDNDSKRISEYVVADCDGDGWHEIISWGLPQKGTTDVLSIWKYQRNRYSIIQQCNFDDGLIGNCYVEDLEGDHEKEILLNRLDGVRAWLEVRGSLGKEILRQSAAIPTPDTDGKDGWDGEVAIETCTDLDMDGIKDVICSFRAGFDRLPRAVMAFSGATLHSIGTFETAGIPGHIKTYEPRAASGTIILFGSAAVNNGRHVGVFADSIHYLCALDEDFRLMWYHANVSGISAAAYAIQDLDSDGQAEAVFCRETEDGPAGTPYRLEIREAASDSLKRYLDLRHGVVTLNVKDINRDARPEIIIALADGTVRILDSELKPIRERAEGIPVNIFLVEDVDLDGRQEIVARHGGSTLAIYDSDLRLLALRGFQGRVTKIGMSVPEESKPFLLASVGEETGLFELEPAPIGGSVILWVVGAGSVGFACGMLIGLRRRKTGTLSKGTIEAQRGRDQLLTSLAAFGHSGVARGNLERLAQYCENKPDPDDPRTPTYRRRLASIVETYRDFTRGLLLEIVSQCTNQREIKEQAADLGRHIHLLDTIIMPESGTAATAEHAGTEANRISSSARAILENMRTLRRDILASYRTEVPTVICRVLSAMRERLEENNIRKVSRAFEGDGTAQVDEEALKTCLEILITNAVEAMEERGSKELRVTTQSADGCLTARMSDTGIGLQADSQNRIFERDFSTKGPGRGLGLYHVRQTLAKYGASIRVESSSPAQGTVLAIRLRAAETSRAVKPENTSNQKVRT